jgi:hypothetical protein
MFTNFTCMKCKCKTVKCKIYLIQISPKRMNNKLKVFSCGMENGAKVQKRNEGTHILLLVFG